MIGVATGRTRLTPERVAAAFGVPVVVAALLVIPTVVVETARPGAFSPGVLRVASVCDWAIWIVFLAELAAMLAVVDDRRRWLRQHPLETAVVVLTPPVVPAVIQAIRVLRLLRLLRLLRVAKLGRSVFSLNGLRYVAFLAGLTALGGGAAFARIEGVSSWDGVWWSITTMTTVGYGDFAPQTVAGRVLAIGVMLVGIGFTAVLTGAVAERFLSGRVAEETETIEQSVVSAEIDLLDELRAIQRRLDVLAGEVERQRAPSAAPPPREPGSAEPNQVRELSGS